MKIDILILFFNTDVQYVDPKMFMDIEQEILRCPCSKSPYAQDFFEDTYTDVPEQEFFMNKKSWTKTSWTQNVPEQELLLH